MLLSPTGATQTPLQSLPPHPRGLLSRTIPRATSGRVGTIPGIQCVSVLFCTGSSAGRGNSLHVEKHCSSLRAQFPKRLGPNGAISPVDATEKSQPPPRGSWVVRSAHACIYVAEAQGLGQRPPSHSSFLRKVPSYLCCELEKRIFVSREFGGFRTEGQRVVGQ